MKNFFYISSAVIIFTGLVLLLRPKSLRVESHQIGRGDFEETLTIEGKIRSRHRQTVYAYAVGNITGVQVKVGDAVTRGQVITRLDWDQMRWVKSPMNGVISKIYRESAGPINRGEPIFEVSGLEELDVVADLLTPDAVRLRPGTQARVQNWGGTSELLAHVTQISRAGSIKISALGVEEERTEVKLALHETPSEIKNKVGDNYHVDLVFVLSKEADVLTVPLGALFKTGNDWAVYVIQDGRARLRKIQLSKRNDQWGLVRDGLSEGSRVILFPGDRIREGSRVQF